MSNDLIDPQPAPVANERQALWELVIADAATWMGEGDATGERGRGAQVQAALLDDMRARDRFGREKYGTPLQAGNGRDALADAYQEALDLCVYLKQADIETPSFAVRATYRAALDFAVAVRNLIWHRDRGQKA